MWSYYGSKSKIVDYYPAPKYDTIIEPFAGSARYALKHWDRNIILVDKNPIITNLWKWLQKCSIGDLLKLPVLKTGDRISDYDLSSDEKVFLGFIGGEGCSIPQNVVTPYAGIKEKFHYKIRETAKILEKIRHWIILNDDYSSIKNQRAVWFIDPPYVKGGEYYKFSSLQIDYKKLSLWCIKRLGQTIVCENSEAKWLPFKFLKNTTRTEGRKSTEVVWINENKISKISRIDKIIKINKIKGE